jgi:hypothetical protein
MVSFTTHSLFFCWIANRESITFVRAEQMPTGVAVPAGSSAFRFSQPYLRVISATALSCGTIVALDCSDSC